MKKYLVSEEQKKQFASLYLLNAIINDEVSIPVYLEGNDADLEPVLEYLMAQKYCEIENGEYYVATGKGCELLEKFMARYSEFLKIFDIYCAVDLEEGSFAFEHYFEMNDHEWNKYINEERWEDLRVAVAEFKQLNPVEIVFMSFLKEGEFGDRGNGWQFDLLLGTVWDEILEVCNTALTKDDLAYTDEDGELIDGDNVLRDVIAQGAELNLELHKISLENEEAFDEEDEEEEDEYITEVTEVEYVTYESYYDPFYISPLWAVVLFI
jgi:hypothetical protein